MDYIYSEREIIERNKKCEEIQKQYVFKIPKYILIELIKPIYNRLEVALLIDMAVMNNRFTEEEGELLKNKYCN